ncbi:MAG: hypothetical protein HZB61_11605 [Nitrospirae bacterium]|nr:hypothetical protein [Nitrospirota bacterium]
MANTDGECEWVIGQLALQYGLKELSTRKRQTYLQAEFPHLWDYIEKFIGGKSEYTESAMRNILDKDWKRISDDLVSIGLFRKKIIRDGKAVYWVPFLYRQGLEMTQGKT